MGLLQHFEPVDLDSPRELGRVYNTLGRLHLVRGEPKEAEEAYRRSLEVQQALARAGDRDEFRQDRGGSMNDLGRVLAEQGRFDDARREFEGALALYDGLARENPDVPLYRQRRAYTRHNLGLLFFTSAQAESEPRRTELLHDAEQHFRRAMEDRERLAREYPATPTYRHELAVSWSALAGVHGLTKRHVAASEAYAKALATQREVVDRFGDVPEWRSELGGILDNLAHFHLHRLASPADATKHLADALPHHLAALQRRPNDATVKTYLRNHRALEVDLALRQKDPAAAAKLADEFPALFPQLGAERFRAAEVLARCLALVEADKSLADGERSRRTAALADQALKRLREALTVGYGDAALLKRHAKSLNGAAFAALRKRPEFGPVGKAWEAAASR
jgi:tetratricopeptide (TPR) repeat protein